MNFIHGVVDWLIYCQRIGLWKWRMFFRLLLSGSGFPLPWVNKIVIFTHFLLKKKLIVNDILYLHKIIITHMEYLNKIHNLLVFLNVLYKKPRIRDYIKYASDIAEVLGIKGHGTLKAIIIEQNCITAICNVLSWITIYLDIIQIFKSLIQSTIWVRIRTSYA